MALRAIRVVIPSGAGVFKALNVVHKAGFATSSVRSMRYSWVSFLLGEKTLPRFNEHSKIITVDGNLASGKGAFAQKLADKMGMLYMPEADAFYMDRVAGEKVPLSEDFNGLCSLEKFYTDPKALDGNSYRLQFWLYQMRLMQYADAVEHLLSTGQGVVLERSPFSDRVFLDAMFKEGYIRKECVQHYNEIKGISICEFLPPHLVIYLEQSAEEVQKKLKQSGKSYLQNVPLSYLKTIEDGYKKTFLPEISETSELLVYDLNQDTDVEKVAEDIEYLKFDKGPWLEQDDVSYHHMRLLVQDKHRIVSLTNVPLFLPEITIGAHEFDQLFYAYKSLPGKEFAPGYNADVGDQHIWLK